MYKDLGYTNKSTNLTWVQRIKICIDVARGVNYLHTRVEGEQRIVHRDIQWRTHNFFAGVQMRCSTIFSRGAVGLFA
ncbi:putative protein kinase RLK-Pelle-CrRLK1L-1 family [Helianthus anomalus]